MGQAELMTPEQKQFLNSLIGNVGPLAQQAFPGLLKGYDENLFQSGVVDPSMRQYQQQILPAIQQRFVDANAGSSSALNQALTQSAGDLSNVLAGQRINLQQSMSGQQLGALGQILGLLGQRSFDPIVQGPQGGLVKDLIAGGSQLGAASIMASSEQVKTNIKDYGKGLDVARELNVKQYDYTIPMNGNEKNRVGLIAESVPEELQAKINGINGVDMYGLVSVLLNCVKELDQKVKSLEAQCQLLSPA